MYDIVCKLYDASYPLFFHGSLNSTSFILRHIFCSFLFACNYIKELLSHAHAYRIFDDERIVCQIIYQIKAMLIVKIYQDPMNTVIFCTEELWSVSSSDDSTPKCLVLNRNSSWNFLLRKLLMIFATTKCSLSIDNSSICGFDTVHR
jgi:hypothetical protein